MPFYGADDCEFQIPDGMQLTFHIKSRVKTRFLGECTTTGAEQTPLAWILDLGRSTKKDIRAVL